MPDWLIAAFTAAIPGLLAVGALFVRVQRLEADMDKRVSRELFDVHVRNVERELGEIKALLLARVRDSGGG